MKNLNKKLFIHAVNIHQGGGKKLLLSLLMAVDKDQPCIVIVDERISLPEDLSASIEIQLVRKSILSRLRAEIFLYRSSKKNDTVICFGNLPPLLKLKAFTSVYVQNRYLLDRLEVMRGLSAWPQLRIFIERLWLRLMLSRGNQYIVQTPSMYRLINQLTKNMIPVKILPFAEIYASTLIRPTKVRNENPTFIYVASGEEHKNHRCLIEAWGILAVDGVRPSLLLTLDPKAFPELCAWINEQIMINNLLINNLGNVNSITLEDYYAQADALIYPSKFESFGLPLIEAFKAGLPIIAAELDYVRDVVVAEQSFDPTSAISISRAVKRFCGIEEPLVQILSPDNFLDALIEK